MAAGTERAAQARRHGAVLRAIGLEKRYGPVHAVRGVDFSLEPNSYVTLLGPSGCGKTSILRMIGGFEEISGGTLELYGQSLAGVPANLRPVNTVFQSYALFPHLSVAENVGFGLAYKRLDNAAMRQKVHAALATVRMTDMADRRPRQLSGGQQQRVALARAIVNEPQLLLLDEPLSALDRRMRKDMQIELKDIQRRLGLAFLHVTHDQEEAFALSDRIIVMNHGRIEQQGTPEDVYRRPATAYVADFIGGANRIPGRILSARGNRHVIGTPLGTFEAPGVASLADGAPATLCIRPEQFRIIDAASVRGTVSHLVFRGSEWLVEVAVEAGLRLEVTTADAEPPPVGAAVALSFVPHSAWIASGDGLEV